MVFLYFSPEVLFYMLKFIYPARPCFGANYRKLPNRPILCISGWNQSLKCRNNLETPHIILVNRCINTISPNTLLQ